jgi:Zn-dependent protease with chaperone function
MNALLDLVAVVATAFVVVASLVALACAALLPLLRRRFARLALQGRTATLLAWLAAPLLAAAAAVLVAFVPSMLAPLGLMPDHCLLEPQHLHLCFLHPPRDFQASPWGWVWLAVAAGGALRALRHVAIEAFRGWRLSRSLRAVATRHPTHDVLLVESSTPIAVTAGFTHPRVFMSSGLLAAFRPEEIAMAIAHERCHVEERHGRTLLLGALAGAAHFGRVQRHLLEQLELACERRADEAAARRVGDRVELAGTLLAARRLLADAGRAGAMLALSQPRSLAARVQALLEPTADHPPGTRRVGLFAALALVGLVVSCELVHNSLETLLSGLVW